MQRWQKWSYHIIWSYDNIWSRLQKKTFCIYDNVCRHRLATHLQGLVGSLLCAVWAKQTTERKSIIATDKRGYPHNIFLFLHENICCGYSITAPRQGASNEYPQHTFSREIIRYQHFSDEKSALSVAMSIHLLVKMKVRLLGTWLWCSLPVYRKCCV